MNKFIDILVKEFNLPEGHIVASTRLNTDTNKLTFAWFNKDWERSEKVFDPREMSEEFDILVKKELLDAEKYNFFTDPTRKKIEGIICDTVFIKYAHDYEAYERGADLTDREDVAINWNSFKIYNEFMHVKYKHREVPSVGDLIKNREKYKFDQELINLVKKIGKFQKFLELL